MSNLGTNLVRAAAENGERVALRLDDEVLCYRDFLAASQRFAEVLRAAGLKPGDRIGLLMPNILAYPVAFYAAMFAGAIVVPINPLSKAREIGFFVEDSGATFVVAADDLCDEVVRAGTSARLVRAGTIEVHGGEPSDAVPFDLPDDATAVILYTSGTTGRPKGAALTHANLASNAELTAGTITELTRDDVVMGCLPLFHVFGLTCGLNTAVLRAACLTLVPRFDPRKALEVMHRDRVTVFEGVPTMYNALLSVTDRADHDVSALRVCLSGGAPLPVEVLHAFEAAFDCMILEGYGLSETSPVASFNQPRCPRKPGTVGPALPGVEMRVVDAAGQDVPTGEVGEIVIRGTNLMKGYWNRPDATAEAVPDTWFRSGDLGTCDEDRYFTIVDRKKDMIIRGGYNVYPREIEEILYEHPDIVEAAVVGVPDGRLGEEVAAAVTVRPGAALDEPAISEFVKERVAAYKYPRIVWLVEELPKGPTGKILRREVRSIAAAVRPL